MDPSGDYEDLSLFPTTFDRLQRKVQVADAIGKKKLASPDGMSLVCGKGKISCQEVGQEKFPL